MGATDECLGEVTEDKSSFSVVRLWKSTGGTFVSQKCAASADIRAN